LHCKRHCLLFVLAHLRLLANLREAKALLII
jgi:hypothetical protein